MLGSHSFARAVLPAVSGSCLLCLSISQESDISIFFFFFFSDGMPVGSPLSTGSTFEDKITVYK